MLRISQQRPSTRNVVENMEEEIRKQEEKDWTLIVTTSYYMWTHCEAQVKVDRSLKRYSLERWARFRFPQLALERRIEVMLYEQMSNEGWLGFDFGKTERRESAYLIVRIVP